MGAFFSCSAAVLVAVICLYAAASGVDVYESMCTGAKRGLSVLGDMLPALVCLFPALWLFRSSVLFPLLEKLLSPVFEAVGVPAETMLIVLLRPLSGSAALSEAAAVMERFGADSPLGRTAAVMLGSSETTFYVIAVYFGAAGVKNSRWALPAALAADTACFMLSAWLCRIFWG